MDERVRIDDVRRFQEEARAALASLDELDSDEMRSYGAPPSGDLAVVGRAARLALVAAASGLGECREDTPYAPLYPLIENGTFKWCCTHDPSHCSS
jgi:hypothetical protein